MSFPFPNADARRPIPMLEHPSPDDALQSLLVRTTVLVCFRNSKLEDIHAGLAPVTKTGDYSDVTVIDADGRRIPWPEVSHIDDDAMRDLMREVVDRLYAFEQRAGEPGFLDRIGPWMDVASRWDEPKLVEAFLTAPTEDQDAAMTETVVDGPGPRHTFALHPVPVEDLLHRVYIIFQESDGRVWAAGTDMMAPDLDSAELFVDRLNETLGIDRAAWSALATRAFAADQPHDG